MLKHIAIILRHYNIIILRQYNIIILVKIVSLFDQVRIAWKRCRKWIKRIDHVETGKCHANFRTIYYLLWYIPVLTVNFIATGNNILCDWRLKTATYINIHVVQMKRFLAILKRMQNPKTPSLNVELLH